MEKNKAIKIQLCPECNFFDGYMTGGEWYYCYNCSKVFNILTNKHYEKEKTKPINNSARTN